MKRKPPFDRSKAIPKLTSGKKKEPRFAPPAKNPDDREDPTWLFGDEESPFSRDHAKLSKPGHCWICLLPLGNRQAPEHLRKSDDHVVPVSVGGGNQETRPAHNICNHVRGDKHLYPDLIENCRRRVLNTLRDTMDLWPAQLSR